MSNPFQNFANKIEKRLRRKKNASTLGTEAKRTNKVLIKYKKDDGKVSWRLVSPYELKAHRSSGRKFLYGTDDKDGSRQIKAFAYDNIIAIKPANKSFRPRWPVVSESMASKKKK